MRYLKKSDDNQENYAMMRAYYGLPSEKEIVNMSEIELSELEKKLGSDGVGFRVLQKEWARREYLYSRKLAGQPFYKSKIFIAICKFLSTLLIAFLVYYFGWK